MTCATPAKPLGPRSSAREWFSRCRRVLRPQLLLAALALASLAESNVTGQPRLDRGPDAWELSGSVRLEDADHVARSRLERLDRFLASQQWEEAVETLMTVMDESGEAVIPVTGMQSPTDDVFSRYVTLRTYCQIRLARLARTAPEALATYRGRVDPLAEQWYREGIANRDADRLRQVLDQFFVSSWGDDALLAWGELQLQRGRFGLARGAWERIGSAARVPESPPEWLPGLPGRPLWLALSPEEIAPLATAVQTLIDGETEIPAGWLSYPDSDIDPAKVIARLATLSILEGARTRAEIELALLRVWYPDSEGTIGGRSDRLVGLIDQLLEDSRTWPEPASGTDWPTLGGSARRTCVTSAAVDIALRPIWTLELPRALPQVELPMSAVIAENEDAGLSYFPVVAGRTVLVQAGESIEEVMGVDLHTGEPLWPLPALGGDGAESSPARQPRQLRADEPDFPWRAGLGPRGGLLGGGMPSGQSGLPRYTLTVDEGILYAKLGRQATSIPRSERFEPPPPGALVAMDLAAEKKRVLEISLDSPEWNEGWSFEGAPVVERGRIYVALRRRDSLRAQLHVACFDAGRGDLRWRRFVAAADTIGSGSFVEYTHNLLCLDQGRLYVNTNLGAVAALRADDGHLQWLLRYPRQPDSQDDPDRSLLHLRRDLNPCVVDRDQVYVAPADCDRIFALDAATGMVLWTTAPPATADVLHLLGVASGNLIASGRRLYWLDTRTGRQHAVFPGRDERSLRGFGRGVLAGDVVYWPTREQILVMDQAGLRSRRQPIDLRALGLTGGNLVIADGVLLVAGTDRLAAFNETGVISRVAGVKE